jgi:hypothetical protein|nr:SWIM zinc finger family protein [Kofleriaceae bacterium]
MIDHLDIPVSFAPAEVTVDATGATRLAIATDATRAQPRVVAQLARPGVVRDALLTLGDVLASDLRRKATDRSDYLKYLLGKNKKITPEVWAAQKEYLALQYGAAATRDEPLSPVLTVDDAAIRIEVMSRDESAYAQLTLHRAGALTAASAAAGTTLLNLDAAALAGIARLRGHRATTLELAPRTPDTHSHATRRVPLRYLRTFGQMQAATLLASTRFELAPIDLYNVLFALRTRKARTSPRALRYELVPGERPRVVLEPWELAIRATGGAYQGTRPSIIRTWGRQRLGALARILPHAKRVTVAVAGPGLPTQYIVDLGDATLAIALSGWTDAGWAGVSTFDLLAADTDAGRIDALVATLASSRAGIAPDALAQHTRSTRAELRPQLLAALAQLRVGHDLASGQFFARPLVAELPAADALRFGGPREAAAHRILSEPGAVTITKQADQPEGRTISGQVVARSGSAGPRSAADGRRAESIDGTAARAFSPEFTIDRDGRTTKASCTCSDFRRTGLKDGPCEHMIALRLFDAREQARREAERTSDGGRANLTAETRELFRRTAAGAESYRISLDGRDVIARFGVGQALRAQHLRFDTLDEARQVYLARLEQLAQKGYVDASRD